MTGLRVSALACAALAVASLWYVQAAPRTPGAYRQRAADSLDALRSNVESARLWIVTSAEGRTLRTSEEVALREADEDAGAAAAGFGSLDPPRGTTGDREDFTRIGDDVEVVLSSLRISAGRGDWPAVERAAGALPRLSDRLERLASRERAR